MERGICDLEESYTALCGLLDIRMELPIAIIHADDADVHTSVHEAWDNVAAVHTHATVTREGMIVEEIEQTHLTPRA
jgi:hypothetical protein